MKLIYLITGIIFLISLLINFTLPIPNSFCNNKLVAFLEISKLDEKTIKNKIEKANYLYVGGGNTFYLLQELKRKNLVFHAF